jgi:hypothetical protein
MYKQLNTNIQNKIDKYIINYYDINYKNLLKELQIIINEIEYRELINKIDNNDYKNGYYKYNLTSQKMLYLIYNKNERIKKKILYYIFSNPKKFRKLMFLYKCLKYKITN